MEMKNHEVQVPLHVKILGQTHVLRRTGELRKAGPIEIKYLGKERRSEK